MEVSSIALMYTSASLKRSSESVYHLWIATKNAFASSLYVRRTMIAVHPRRYIAAEYGDSCCIIWIFSRAAAIALEKFCGLVTKSMFNPFLSKRSEACAFAFRKNLLSLWKVVYTIMNEQTDIFILQNLFQDHDTKTLIIYPEFAKKIDLGF